MASKTTELQGQIDRAHILMTERGVPVVAGDIAARIEVLLDAKSDVEKDLEFETSRSPASIVQQLLDETADVNEDDKALARAFLTYGNLAPKIIDTLLAPILQLSAVKKLTEFQQKDLIDSLSARVRAQLAYAMKIMAAQQHPTLSAANVEFSVKGSVIKLKMEATKTSENLLLLGGIGAGTIDIVFTDVRALDDGNTKVEAKPEKDEPPLPLEEAAAREPDHPADDADLNDGTSEPSFLDGLGQDDDGVDAPAGDDVDQTAGEVPEEKEETEH